ncbi:DUF2597 family protein [Orbus wheelerorum]|uniref:phage protein n=1 Tax=Orbus wheelerorum TaxID=3074111 RepID=UPI00370D848D
MGNNSRINAKAFDITMWGDVIQAQSASISITDNTAAAKTNGVPDGTLQGSVEASGSIVFSSKYFKVLKAKAQSFGSYRDIPPVDLMFYANTGSEELQIEVFGCKLTITDLLNVDKSSDDSTMHTVPFIVTSPDFIKIDGVPYLSADDTRHLLNA